MEITSSLHHVLIDFGNSHRKWMLKDIRPSDSFNVEELIKLDEILLTSSCGAEERIIVSRFFHPSQFEILWNISSLINVGELEDALVIVILSCYSIQNSTLPVMDASEKIVVNVLDDREAYKIQRVNVVVHVGKANDALLSSKVSKSVDNSTIFFGSSYFVGQKWPQEVALLLFLRHSCLHLLRKKENCSWKINQPHLPNLKGVLFSWCLTRLGFINLHELLHNVLNIVAGNGIDILRKIVLNRNLTNNSLGSGDELGVSSSTLNVVIYDR